MSLNNFGIVAKGLSRSAQPDADGINVLRNYGIKLILKLNFDNEYPFVRETNNANPIEVRQIPLDPFNPDEQEVRSLVEMIRTNLLCGTSVHVHCSHGRDRTGLVIGAWQILYGGVSLSDVLTQRKSYGTSWLGDFTADREIVEMLEKFSKEKTQ